MSWTMIIVRGWLRCKGYKDGDNLPIYLIMMWLCKCGNLTDINFKERKYIWNYYWAMTTIITQGTDPVTYIKLWWLINSLMIFKKRTLA